MRALTAPALTDAMDGILTTQEIDALLARRDVILELFDAKIAQRSEAAVVYTQPR
jgi:Trp operon repressor